MVKLNTRIGEQVRISSNENGVMLRQHDTANVAFIWIAPDQIAGVIRELQRWEKGGTEAYEGQEKSSPPLSAKATPLTSWDL